MVAKHPLSTRGSSLAAAVNAAHRQVTPSNRSIRNASGKSAHLVTTSSTVQTVSGHGSQHQRTSSGADVADPKMIEGDLCTSTCVVKTANATPKRRKLMRLLRQGLRYGHMVREVALPQVGLRTHSAAGFYASESGYDECRVTAERPDSIARRKRRTRGTEGAPGTPKAREARRPRRP
jgi:hypothetical protein